MKKKSTVDNINGSVLIDSFEITGDILLGIINESLSSGDVPDKFKISTVITIPKFLEQINGMSLDPSICYRIVTNF